MLGGPQVWLVSLAILLLGPSTPSSQALLTNEDGVKTSIFLSPMFVQEPGSVAEKYYYNVDFPRGHIAIKEFKAEVVDEAGNPVPLQETYLHHWAVLRYYHRQGIDVSKYNGNLEFLSDDIIVPNAGICRDTSPQYFGLGSETRKTAAHVPDPYGIEIGNPAEIPDGYVERWLLNVHAIDTRGAVDRLGCTECRCDLYNVTIDEYDQPLRPGYLGGFKCCHDEMRCRVKEGFERAKRSLYLRYTVKWLIWDNSIVPVKIYIFDVTWKRLDESTRASTKHDCHIEYDIEPCATDVVNEHCIDTKRVSVSMPTGGDVIYGVGHQHSGGIGSALYGENGRVICSSIPAYGEGTEPGNEAGYIVGMSTCYPQPGSVRILDGETLTFVFNYSSTQRHTGVMGLFYILVANPLPKSNSLFQAAVKMLGKAAEPHFAWVQVLFGLAIAVAVVVGYGRARADGYETVRI